MTDRAKTAPPLSGAAAAQHIDAKIAALGDWRGDTLARVRKLIRAADPEVVEEVKWGRTPVWSRDNGARVEWRPHWDLDPGDAAAARRLLDSCQILLGLGSGMCGIATRPRGDGTAGARREAGAAGDGGL